MSTLFDKESLYKTILANWTRTLLPPFLISFFCFLIGYFYNPIFFQLIDELIAIVIGFMASIVASTTREFTKNYFTIFLGSIVGWGAILEVLHMLVDKNVSDMNFSAEQISSQFMISARLFSAVGFLIAPYFLNRKIPLKLMETCNGLATLCLAGLIILQWFPETFIQNQGYTTAKVALEILCIIILATAMGVYIFKKNEMGQTLFVYLFFSLFTILLSEIFFALSPQMLSTSSILGHIFKIFSYWYIYIALVETTLREPFDVLTRSASTYDAIPDPTLLIDSSGQIDQANIAAGLFVNQNAIDLVGQSSHLLFHEPNQPQELCVVCSRLSKTNSPLIIEIKKGEKTWIECSLVPIQANQHIGRWTQVIRDISARKELEFTQTHLLTHLSERQREQHCLATLGALISAPDATLESILQGTVQSLPMAFQYPEYTIAQIKTEWGNFISKNDAELSYYHLDSDIIANKERIGTLNIYLSHSPINPPPQFLEAEVNLVNRVAQQLGDAITNLIANAQIKKLSFLYAMLSGSNKAALRSKNDEELLASLFEALLKPHSFSLIFIGIKNEEYEDFKIVHLCGIPEEDRSLLNHSINQPDGSLNHFIHRLIGGNVIDLSEVIEHPHDTWSKKLQSLGQTKGYLLPLITEDKVSGMIGLYSKDFSITDTEEENLLNEISANVSFALTSLAAYERKSIAEKKAQLFEHRFGEIFMSSPVPMLTISTETNEVSKINPAFETWTGYRLEDIIQSDHWNQQFLGDPFKEKGKDWWRMLIKHETSEQPEQPELTIYDIKGQPHIGRPMLLMLNNDAIIAWTDLTSIRNKESMLAEREKNFHMMIEQPFIGMYVRDEHHFVYTNQRFCDIMGFSAQELQSKTLIDIAGYDDEAKSLILEKWNEIQHEKKSISYKLNTKRKDGTPIMLGLHGVPIEWNEEPAVLAMVEDITEIEQAKEKIETYTSRLEKIFKGTLVAVSNMIELRDPYTAGHERRVGLIAKAIGKELGWDEKHCNALELAGLVHDIGKISIPSEILTKPTRLSNLEMQILKQHPEAGYEILKHIDFDFPVAEIIRQHHERMDGSGYPRGLKGQDILPEARILTVADILESVSSHRPYRPALGIDVAMDELNRGKGTMYDAAIVDAALRLIRENRLDLKGMI